ncbi:DNA repair photolyase [Clostridium cavendishii DSM 21758]|uniref:DNA repair photolyase n=1 Tax=Clostridium cavendishii DSM 21758 TaxID=1121302 RepID=A0A1M6SLF8_9CLOT|nr:radical SAM protein [Clostridium cavendishii]SHK45418.1 DNA repair photolyase [Clostridium cavendishii DSM 21758]
MPKEIDAKALLSRNKSPSSWFGTNHLFNIYRGCEHHCIYCDSRSLCYKIDNFDELIVKRNSVDILRKELKSKRKKGVIGTGAMSDPYTKSEKEYLLTRGCLEVIAEYNYPIHITTKSNLILRDIDLLEEINKIYTSVAMTITTTDDNLASIVEPFAPSSSDRFKALGILSTLGICTSITMMPILPFIEDKEENILDIVNKADYYGVKYIVPWIGMSLRDRQRDHYYKQLDKNFPGIREKYEKKFGDRYRCSGVNARKLNYALLNACERYGISLKMPSYYSKKSSIHLNLINKN